MDLLTRLTKEPLPFATLLGIEIVSAAPDKIVAEMMVREELCTRPAVLHGGAVMAFADTLGALGTLANLSDGGRTATIESKTIEQTSIHNDRARDCSYRRAISARGPKKPRCRSLDALFKK
jgi:uncharacterized protein (TIGR00369 family)